MQNLIKTNKKNLLKLKIVPNIIYAVWLNNDILRNWTSCILIKQKLNLSDTRIHYLAFTFAI